MEALDRLFKHLRSRLVDLKKAKEEGRKIIGYIPGGYLPEELVLASEAIPVGMIRGGDHSVIEHSAAFICRWIDTFCRAQIGYGVSGDDPYYGIVDLMVIPITDNHVRAISDVLAYNTEINVFPFGVPHIQEKTANNYYLHGITTLKNKLEEITGVEITNRRLKEAILLCNKERDLLRKISLMRKSQPAPISSIDFVALNHGAHLADKEVMVGILESIYDELREQITPSYEGPRLLLTGSTLAMGDTRVSNLIAEAGGTIVIEEFAEGIKPYWENVNIDRDSLEALADCYFIRRVPPAWFRPAKKRRDFLIELIKQFNVAGVIWYQLMYRESYKLESYLLPEILKRETDLSMFSIQSDYDASEIGSLRTGIETFIETIRR